MFENARIKLTGWYLLIIMGVSIFFSGTIYTFVSTDLERRLFMNELRNKASEWGLDFPRRFPRRMEDLNPETLEKLRKTFVSNELNEARKILLGRLAIVNGIVFVISASLGYFLAGKTLKPIEEAMKKQEQFVSDASHELRTPLTSLRTDFEVSLRDKKLKLKESKKVLKDGLGDIVKLQELSDRLLVLAKNGNGMVKEDFNLKKLIEEEIKKLNKFAKKKKIEIKQDLKNIEIKADKVKIAELVRILVDNAIKYSKSGGKIWVKLFENKKYIIFEIKDKGIGISEHDLTHIFDRFYRVGEARSGNDGFGLGLSIAKKIVKEHKGRIEVESKLKKGSRFIVKLPIRN